MARWATLPGWELPLIAAFAGLFAAAFLAATILPAQSELVLAAMIASGGYSISTLLLVATIGNTLGAVVNWVLGRSIDTLRERRWFPVAEKTLHRGEALYARWGKWSLLLSWAPLIGDALTVAAGIFRVQIGTFLFLVLVAKGGRYLVVAWLVGALW